MNDIEHEVHELLETRARDAVVSPWPQPTVLKRARRRQVRTILAGSATVVVVVIASIFGLRAVVRSDRGTPASPPTVTKTLHGISITVPASWHVIDPDAAGLNGPGSGSDLPRLMLAVSPTEVGDVFGCPGLSGSSAPAFVMTIQEEPLALSGPSSTPWPVSLEPLDVGSGESGCYPGWTFRRAGWTAGGRTFEARVALAPDVSEDDRTSLLDAFASMTFEPATGPPAAVTIATVTDAQSTRWRLELDTTDRGSGLALSVESSSGGSGSSWSGGGCCLGPLHGYLRIDSGASAGENGSTGITLLASERVARVEFTSARGDVIDALLYPMPDTTAGIAQVGLVIIPQEVSKGGVLIAYDARGNELTREPVLGEEATPSPSA